MNIVVYVLLAFLAAALAYWAVAELTAITALAVAAFAVVLVAAYFGRGHASRL